MFSLKVIFVVAAAMLGVLATFSESVHISPQVLVEGKNEQKVRNKRFLFNSFPSGFNTEDYQVRTLMQQQRVLNRVSPVLFNRDNDNFYLQSLLQQRRVRQRYFDITGERARYYNDDNYNNRYYSK